MIVSQGVQAAVKEMDVTLSIRQQQVLPMPTSLERVVVADPEVADVLVVRGGAGQPGSIILSGKKAGQTTVTAWSKGSAVSVWKVSVFGNMQSILAGQSGATLKVQNNVAMLSGVAPSVLSHANSATAALNAVGQGNVLDISTIDSSGVVQIDVKIVEFSKKVLKEAGFDFGGSTTSSNFSFQLGSNLASAGGLTAASSAFNLLTNFNRNTGYSLVSNLRLIEGNGLARVLAEPSLTALSGQSASFLVGGELPIPSAGGLGTTTIVYKPFGIGLTVSPTILSKDRIVLKVAPEASEIDYSNAIVSNGVSIPAITTRRADTTVELGDGESFVIGGLVSRATRSNVNKIPLLGDLPILGTFFRNLSYTQNDKELVIVVTPHLVRPIAKNTKLALPGTQQEQHGEAATVWGSYLLGGAVDDTTVPGFSK
ncbi:MAG: type II and III secretion system protein family protein [Sulfuriferula sp.]|nr:type II and III secretion system protein family protein [Sulfuriferula sp.]